MAVTNYETVNGQILAEYTSGVTTEYVHDALGSVIATTDASRNVQNTYRWAGYGTQIAKTGTASDPKFLWNGTNGYRATGRAHADRYVRRRHYGLRDASWPSVDKNWLSASAYGYCFGQPLRIVDFTGEKPQRRDLREGFVQGSGPTCNSEGIVYWMFREDTGATGWIIQRTELFGLQTCCGTALSKPTFNCGVPADPVYIFGALIGYALTFYEAWWVDKGVAQNTLPGTDCKSWFTPPADGSNDEWDAPGDGCFYGFNSAEGELAFVPATDSSKPPFGLVCNAVPCSHLPSAIVLSGSLAFGQGKGTAFYQFSCCSGTDQSCLHCPVDKHHGCKVPPHFTVNPTADGAWH